MHEVEITPASTRRFNCLRRGLIPSPARPFQPTLGSLGLFTSLQQELQVSHAFLLPSLESLLNSLAEPHNGRSAIPKSPCVAHQTSPPYLPFCRDSFRCQHVVFRQSYFTYFMNNRKINPWQLMYRARKDGPALMGWKHPWDHWTREKVSTRRSFRIMGSTRRP